MKRLTLILMLVASTAFADKVFVPLSPTEGILITSTGPVSVERVNIQSIGVVPVTPVPKDPTDPKPPDPADPLAVKVTALVASAPMTANERRTMSELYLRIGEFPTTEAGELRRGVTFLFGLLPLPVEWKTWKAKVDSFAAPLGVDDVRRVWKLIGEGLVKGLPAESAEEAMQRRLQVGLGVAE